MQIIYKLIIVNFCQIFLQDIAEIELQNPKTFLKKEIGEQKKYSLLLDWT